MSFFSDLFQFDKFRLKDAFKELMDNPWRILTGFDPLSTELNNKILGRDDQPLGNLVGGPSRDQFRRAEEEGIDIGPRKFADDIATILIASDSLGNFANVGGAPEAIGGAGAAGGTSSGTTSALGPAAAGGGGGAAAGSSGGSSILDQIQRFANIPRPGGGAGTQQGGQQPDPAAQQQLAALLQQALRLQEEKRKRELDPRNLSPFDFSTRRFG